MGGSCPKNPKVTESFQQAPLKAKGEGVAWLVATNFLVSDPLFLRSGDKCSAKSFNFHLRFKRFANKITHSRYTNKQLQYLLENYLAYFQYTNI